MHIDVGDGQEWLTSAAGGYNASLAFKAGDWYYVAATVNSADHIATLYFNGRALGSTTFSTYGLPPLLFDPDHPVVVGGDPRYDLIPGNPLPGNFDGIIGRLRSLVRPVSPARPVPGCTAW